MKKKLLLVFLTMLLGVNLVSCSNNSKEEVSNVGKEVSKESDSHNSDIHLTIDLLKDMVTSDEIDSKVSELKENKEEILEKKEDYKNTVDGIKENAENLKGEINTVKDNADGLKDNINNLKEGISDFKNSMENIKNSFSSKK